MVSGSLQHLKGSLLNSFWTIKDTFTKEPSEGLHHWSFTLVSLTFLPLLPNDLTCIQPRATWLNASFWTAGSFHVLPSSCPHRPQWPKSLSTVRIRLTAILPTAPICSFFLLCMWFNPTNIYGDSTMFRDQGQVPGIRAEEDRRVCPQDAQRLAEEDSQAQRQRPGEGAPFRGLHTDPGVRTWFPVLSGPARPPATCGSSQGVCFLPGSHLWNIRWLRSILNKRSSKNDATTSLGAHRLQRWVLQRPCLTSLAPGGWGSRSAQTLGCCARLQPPVRYKDGPWGGEMLHTCAQKEALLSAWRVRRGGTGSGWRRSRTICLLPLSIPSVSSPFGSSSDTGHALKWEQIIMSHCKCLCQSGHLLNTQFSMCSPMDTLMYTHLDSCEQPPVNTHVQSQKYLLILWVSLPLPEISYVLGRLSMSQRLPLCSRRNCTKTILFAQPLLTKRQPP